MPGHTVEEGQRMPHEVHGNEREEKYQQRSNWKREQQKLDTSREPSPIDSTAFQNHCDIIMNDCIHEAQQQIDALKEISTSMRCQVLHSAVRRHCGSSLPSTFPSLQGEDKGKETSEKKEGGRGVPDNFCTPSSFSSSSSSAVMSYLLYASNARSSLRSKEDGTRNSVLMMTGKEWCYEDLTQRLVWIQTKRSMLLKHLHQLATALLEEKKKRKDQNATMKSSNRTGGGGGKWSSIPADNPHDPSRRNHISERDEMFSLVREALGPQWAPSPLSFKKKEVNHTSISPPSPHYHHVDSRELHEDGKGQEEEEEESARGKSVQDVPRSPAHHPPLAPEEFFTGSFSYQHRLPILFRSSPTAPTPLKAVVVNVEEVEEEEEQRRQQESLKQSTRGKTNGEEEEERKRQQKASPQIEESHLSSSAPPFLPSLSQDGGEIQQEEEEDERQFATLYLARFFLDYCKEEESAANVILPLSPSQETFNLFYQEAIAKQQLHRFGEFLSSSSSSTTSPGMSPGGGVRGEYAGIEVGLQLLWKMMEEESQRVRWGGPPTQSSRSVGGGEVENNRKSKERMERNSMTRMSAVGATHANTRLPSLSSSSLSRCEVIVMPVVSSSDEDVVTEEKLDVEEVSHPPPHHQDDDEEDFLSQYFPFSSLSCLSSSRGSYFPCVVVPLVESVWEYCCHAPWLSEESSSSLDEKGSDEGKKMNLLHGSGRNKGVENHRWDTVEEEEEEDVQNILSRMQRMRETHRVPLGYATPPHVLLGSHYVVPTRFLPKAGERHFVFSGGFTSATPSAATKGVPAAEAAAIRVIAAICQQAGGDNSHPHPLHSTSGGEGAGDVFLSNRVKANIGGWAGRDRSSPYQIAARFASSSEIKSLRERAMVDGILKSVERRWTFSPRIPPYSQAEKVGASMGTAISDTSKKRCGLPPPSDGGNKHSGSVDETIRASSHSFSFPPLHLPEEHYTLPWLRERQKKKKVMENSMETNMDSHISTVAPAATRAPANEAQKSFSSLHPLDNNNHNSIAEEEEDENERELVESFLQGLSVRLVVELVSRFLLYQDALRRFSEEETQILVGTPQHRACLLHTPSSSSIPGRGSEEDNQFMRKNAKRSGSGEKEEEEKGVKEMFSSFSGGYLDKSRRSTVFTARIGPAGRGEEGGEDTSCPVVSFSPTSFVPFVVLTLPETPSLFYCLAYAFGACAESDASWSSLSYSSTCMKRKQALGLGGVDRGEGVPGAPATAARQSFPSHKSMEALRDGTNPPAASPLPVLFQPPPPPTCSPTPVSRVLRAITHHATPLLPAIRLWLYLWDYSFQSFPENSSTTTTTSTPSPSSHDKEEGSNASLHPLGISVLMSKYWWERFAIPAARQRASSAVLWIRSHPFLFHSPSFSSCTSPTLPLSFSRMSEGEGEAMGSTGARCSPSEFLLTTCGTQFVKRLEQEVSDVLSRKHGH